MAEKKISEASEVKKYLLHKLRENARALYNVSTSTFDGATARLDASKRYTKEEVAAIIKEWLNKKAEVK